MVSFIFFLNHFLLESSCLGNKFEIWMYLYAIKYKMEHVISMRWRKMGSAVALF